MSTSQVVGVAWYSRAAWTRLRRVVPDPGVLESRYEDWLAMYAKGLADVRRAGLTPERVEIEAEAFLTWCLVTGLAPDSAARARFAADAMRQRYEPGQPRRGV